MRGWPGRLLLLAAAGLVLVLVGGGAAIDYYTDALWFGSLGYASVFWTRLQIGVLVQLAAGTVAAAAVLLNLWVVLRHMGPVRLRRRYGNIEIAEQVPRTYLVAGIVAVSLLAGWWLAALQFGDGSSLSVVAWLRRVSWGTGDPLFGHDISDYVFALPVYFRFVDFALIVLVWSAALVVLGYVLVGSIRWKENQIRLDDHARFHFVVLAAIVVLLLGLRYWLGRYGLLLEGNGIGQGLGYTDVAARLPAHRALTILSVITAGALVYSAWRRTWLPSILAVGALVLAAIFVGNIYPALVQRFRVEPNELDREAPYIRWNIDYTRRAYGLTELQQRQFPYRREGLASWEELEPTLSRLPLWDAPPLRTTYNERQSFIAYYHFPSVDFDRYPTEDGLEQVAISVREFDRFGLPESARTWQTLHLNPRYLRGEGAVVTPAARVLGLGEPAYWLENVDPVLRTGRAPPSFDLTDPGIYVGESLSDYAVLTPGRDSAFLGTPGRDFPEGIQLGSLPRLLAFAWRFGDANLVFSGEPTDDSRIVFRRSIESRLTTLAPFLYWDPDPYPVVHDGRIVWIVDGYAVAGSFPLARGINVEGLGRIRYMRNSVKATVDAVTGDVRLYAADEDDPVLATYRRIFPELIRPLDSMPEALRRHLRYPERYLRVQADILEEYHLDRPEAFYAGQDVWQMPSPSESSDGTRSTYVLLALPGEEEVEFVLMSPFIARERQNMTALLIARNDPPHYGELQLLELPRDQNIPGPSQIESIMEQDPIIASQLSLWRQAGSDVDLGRLRVIPTDSTLLYVEPIFLSAQGSPIPELQRVVASDGTNVSMASTLQEAVESIRTGEPSPTARVADIPTETVQPALEEWPARALDLLEQAEQRLREGDWSGFGEAWSELRQLLSGMAEAP